jgi:hypothetical protein
MGYTEQMESQAVTNIDMRHLDYLRVVAEGDVSFLEERERTYQGSWKRSGGRSAWFMLRRKIDRLLVMMARPPAPAGFDLKSIGGVVLNHDDLEYLRACYVSEDIFLKIEAEPGGEDGTVLAEIRDLRRYLCLVEAEMMARGVVAVDEKTRVEILERVLREPCGPVVVNEDGSVRAERMPRKSDQDARDDGVDPVQDAIDQEARARRAGAAHQDERPDIPRASGHSRRGELHVDLQRSQVEVRNERISEAGLTHQDERPGTLADGGHVEPWTLARARTFVLGSREAVSILYRDWTQSYVVLESAITSAQKFQLSRIGDNETDAVRRRFLREVVNLYVACGEHHVLRIAGAPPADRDLWPVLRREVNSHEHGELEPWRRGAYRWDEAAAKWILRDEHAAWAEGGK